MKLCIQKLYCLNEVFFTHTEIFSCSHANATLLRKEATDKYGTEIQTIAIFIDLLLQRHTEPLQMTIH